ncbi:hypothetical protein LVB77_07140 [Lysobacter sp. 5GHs7-4]|uniref:hypothetical protein n=1 Tax=Lysobacter sp. 5GHs7-4 TaxID=2904253 RepID=UPI001E319599|nr:hypothetical protein [Lysobacter sp. 5GHs7-4]UHQ24454.1 hypothetical protein LVB77_07140 [Lysobacter sp. 5GHs7-4]
MPGDIFINGNPFIEVLYKFPCPQRVLMVADGSLDFGTGGFGLSEFVQIVRNAGHTVTTAHRSGSGPASLSIAGNYNFATAATAVTVANYDQIWLFAFSTTALQPAEQQKIAQFMRDGGGLFATGDHDTIGAGMGANLPRVRTMRDWSSIPMATVDRHDTVLEHGADGIKQFNDQADAIPQRMFPVFFSNGGDPFAAATWAVHPVLRHSSGAVDYLPDHPHESRCLAPAPVAGNFAGVEEWPAPSGGGPRIAPVVVAVSISAGRFIVSGAPTASGTKPPVYPRSFGAISAYDGDPAAAGRIVCDATWHHFVNINLNGSGAGNDPTTGLPRTGLYAGGLPTPEYLKIRAYYLNTVRWLAPIGRRYCWPFLVAAAVRFDYEIAELRLPLPHPCPWDPLLKIGRAVEEVLLGRLGQGALADVVDGMLATAGRGSGLARLLDTAQAQTERKEGEAPLSLLPLQDMRRAVLGTFVNLLASKLPEDEQKLASIMRDHDGLAIDGIAESLRAAEAVIVEQIGKALEASAAQLQTLRAQPVSAGKPVKRPVAGGGKAAAPKKPAAKPKKVTRQ